MIEGKILVHQIEEFFANNLAYQVLNFCLGAELLNFAVFSLIFDANISVLDRVIPCQDFL